MAVVSASLTSAILGVSQGSFPGSQLMPRIASAVGKSVPAWLPIPTNVTAQGVTAGTAGAGTVTGKLFVTAGGPIVVQALQAAGLNGTTAVGLGTAVGSGLASVLNSSWQYSGTSAGVGTGSDTSKISNANSATLVPILLGNLQGATINGQLSSRLALGLANGISQVVQTGFGTGGVTGSASPSGATGTSVSVTF